MQDLVEELSILLVEKSWKIATAESCTGGLLSAAITHRPGSSVIFDRGFVTYSNEAKAECLGVPETLIDKHGAVSPEVAESMAHGAITHSFADLAISLTGIAGPDGGSEDKPVGLVYIGYGLKNGAFGSSKYVFEGNREHVRSKAAATALRDMVTILKSEG